MTATTEQYKTTVAAPPVQIKQFSLAGVIGTWAAAALPMAVLAWVIGPWLARRFDGPTATPRALILALTIGLVWQFLLVMLLVYREQRSLRWRVLKDALWLHAPRRPKTGRRGGKAWLVIAAEDATARGVLVACAAERASLEVLVLAAEATGR